MSEAFRTQHVEPSRRSFLQTAAAGAAAGIGVSNLSGTLSVARGAHAAGGDELKIALIGCGGRGSGAASQALRADKNVRLVAMADAFADRLENSLMALSKEEEIAKKIDVPPERRFVGFEAYREAIAAADVVLLCTPPHFRPIHLAAAVEAGKHAFVEKPVATDAPGVRSVLATCEKAREKGLSVVSGLCLRYDLGFQETVRRLRDGALGEIRTLYANDYRGGIWLKPRQPDWTDMHWQMRNWYYFTWLSGDFNVEQHVHFLDVCAWVMRDEYPVKAIGIGGRQVRTGPEYGNIYDHFSIVYEYASGARLISNCRQQPACDNDLSAQVAGAKGTALLSEKRKGLWIKTDSTWHYEGATNDMYQAEHDAFFASIRQGKPINNGEYMSYSTLLAIQGRMAAYTGRQITWEMALNSKEDLSPKKYEWGEIAAPPIAIPGITKFV